MMDNRNKSDIERFSGRSANWALVERRNRRTLFRFVGASNEEVWMMAVGEVKNGVFIPYSSPPSSWRQQRRSIAELQALARARRLFPVREHGIPGWMKKETIPNGADELLDKRRSIVDFVAKKWGTVFIADTDSYNEAMNDAAEEFGVSSSVVRKLVAQHLFYGGHPNALVPLSRRMGAKSALRVLRRQPRVDINGGVR